MRAMQVMVDMVMDLLDRIAREAASLLELERKDTLTVDASSPPQNSSVETARTERTHAGLSWS